MLVIMMMIMFFVIVTYQAQAEGVNGEIWFVMTHSEKVSYLVGYYEGIVVAYLVAVEYGYIIAKDAEFLLEVYDMQMIINDIIIAIDDLYMTDYYDKQDKVISILFLEFVIRKSKNEI